MAPPAQDRLDELLRSYERRKQEETRALVEKAKKLEADRQRGSHALRTHALSAVRDACRRIREAGHEVGLDERLDAYPPSVRIHMWVKAAPLSDPPERPRWSLELVWGEPRPGMLCAQRWSSTGLQHLTQQGTAAPEQLDEIWVKEQIHLFVEQALA